MSNSCAAKVPSVFSGPAGQGTESSIRQKPQSVVVLRLRGILGSRAGSVDWLLEIRQRCLNKRPATGIDAVSSVQEF